MARGEIERKNSISVKFGKCPVFFIQNSPPIYLTFPCFSPIFRHGAFFIVSSCWGSPVLKLQVRLFLFFLIVLPVTQSAAATPSQDIWRVDLRAVARLSAEEQWFSKLSFYRWQEDRWQISNAETFFQTHQPEIPLIVFAPGYTSTTSQTTKVGLGLVRTFNPQKACRVVFWDWYSERGNERLRRDVRSKLPVIDHAAGYLALFLQKLEPQSKVCLFGFSFGSRVVCNATEALRKNGQAGLRLHLVLAGAATDRDWFAQGQRHGRVPEIAEKILVTYNPDDWVLRFYPFLYEFSCRAKALGYAGLPMRNIPPEFRDKFENINVERYIGDEHQTLFHVRTAPFQSRIDTYFFFE